MAEKQLRDPWIMNERGQRVCNAKVAFGDAWSLVTPVERRFLVVVVIGLLIVLGIHWS